MKHLIFITLKSITVTSLIILSSCKKEYTCNCEQIVIAPPYTNNGKVYSQQISVSTFSNSFKSKKNESESICKKAESVKTYPSTYSNLGQGQTVETITCELK